MAAGKRTPLAVLALGMKKPPGGDSDGDEGGPPMGPDDGPGNADLQSAMKDLLDAIQGGDVVAMGDAFQAASDSLK